MNPAEAESTRRLAVVQMQDLGVDRASYITGVDTKNNTRSVDLAKLENARAANMPGTREYADAQKHQTSLNAWKSAFTVLQHDGANDGKEDIGGGQTHRDQLLREQAEERARLASRFNSGRGGRTRGGGRGGGVIGTRGRGDYVKSSSREVPVVPPPSPTTRQASRGRSGTKLSNPILPSSRRTSPGNRAVHQAPRRQSLHPRSTVNIPSTAERVGVQRTVPREVFRGGFQLADPGAFMAAVGRSTITSSSSSHDLLLSTQPLAFTTSRRLEHRSTLMSPVVTTNIPPIVEPEVMFSPDVNSAPMGLRMPTSPPAGHSSYHSSSGIPYSTDLLGLDLSPKIPQDLEHKTAEEFEYQRMTDRSFEAAKQGEGLLRHGTIVADTEVPREHGGLLHQSDRMPGITTKAPQHIMSTDRIGPDSSTSTVLLSSQAILDHLLTLNLPPAAASSIVELQATLRAEQLKYISTDMQTHPNILSEQSTGITHVTELGEEPSKSVVDRTSTITNITKQNQTGFTKNISHSKSELVRVKRIPSTTLPKTYTVWTTRTLLEPGHENLVSRVRDAIPLGGTLQDSDHSVTYYPHKSIGNRDLAAIIGEHILPNGWRRKHDASHSSVISTTGSQATVHRDTGGATSETLAAPSQARTSTLEIDAVSQRSSQLQLRQYTSRPITITTSAQASTPIPAPASAASTSVPATKLRMRDVPYIPDNAAAHQYSRQERQATSLATSTNLTRGLGVHGSAATSRSQTIIPIGPSTHAQTSSPKRNTFSSNDMTTSRQTIATPAAVISPIRATVRDRGSIRAFESDKTPEVCITVSPIRARAPMTREQDQVIGGSIGASMWSNTAGTRGLGVSLGKPIQTLTEVTGDSFNRGLAPNRDARPGRSSGASLSTDPGIGNTSTLFTKYERPRGSYQVPAFIAASATARQAADPDATTRAQYGLAPLPVVGGSSRENRPLRKSKFGKDELDGEIKE